MAMKAVTKAEIISPLVSVLLSLAPTRFCTLHKCLVKTASLLHRMIE